MRVCILAPGHDELDHRVLRSLVVLKKVFSKVHLYLENDRVTNFFISSNDVDSYQKFSILNLLLLRKGAIKGEVYRDIEDCNIVYIHDSGLYGIILIRYLNNFFPNKSVVFDYHDLISWEVQHHLSKLVRLKSLVGIFHKLLHSLLNIFIVKRLNIKAVIGISDGQVSNFVQNIQALNKIKTHYVPNTRVKATNDISLSHNLDEHILNLLWVGNIGANRYIGEVFKYAQLIKIKLEEAVNVAFIGKTYGECDANLKGASYLGGYQTDSDALKLVPKGKSIGVFFGWNDIFKTDINAIASPNKIYTYINIGIPFLVPSKLQGIVDEFQLNDRFVYNDDIDFIKKAAYIFENYSNSVGLVLKIKKQLKWDSCVQKDLFDFYSSLKND